MKRFVDVMVSALVILIFSPFWLIIGIVIKLYDGGPVIFRQKRIGKGGNEFHFMKFRSMPVNTPNVVSTQTAVLKVTPVGKIIRRTNLDEIPQFINVLKGDMSIIGPRPSLPSQTSLLELRKQNGSIKLRPGLTGWAQVNAYDYMPEEEKASLDGEYYQKFGLWMDLRIILGTIKYFTKKPPVY
jgi:O-antigen biosynthesis protein WbqP